MSEGVRQTNRQAHAHRQKSKEVHNNNNTSNNTNTNNNTLTHALLAPLPPRPSLPCPSPPSAAFLPPHQQHQPIITQQVATRCRSLSNTSCPWPPAWQLTCWTMPLWLTPQAHHARHAAGGAPVEAVVAQQQQLMQQQHQQRQVCLCGGCVCLDQWLCYACVLSPTSSVRCAMSMLSHTLYLHSLHPQIPLALLTHAHTYTHMCARRTRWLQQAQEGFNRSRRCRCHGGKRVRC